MIGETDNPFAVMASSRALIHTSYHESFAIVLVEAMASGTPVVCANKLPMSEIVGNGGFTFKLNDSNDLAEKIINLLKNDSLLKSPPCDIQSS